MPQKKEVIDGQEYIAVALPFLCKDGKVRILEPLVPVEQVDAQGNLKNKR